MYRTNLQHVLHGNSCSLTAMVSPAIKSNREFSQMLTITRKQEQILIFQTVSNEWIYRRTAEIVEFPCSGFEISSH